MMIRDNTTFSEGEVEIFLRFMSSVPVGEQIAFHRLAITRVTEEEFKVKLVDKPEEIEDMRSAREKHRQEELKRFLGESL